jgi:hypothetical protein
MSKVMWIKKKEDALCIRYEKEQTTQAAYHKPDAGFSPVAYLGMMGCEVLRAVQSMLNF